MIANTHSLSSQDSGHGLTEAVFGNFCKRIASGEPAVRIRSAFQFLGSSVIYAIPFFFLCTWL